MLYIENNGNGKSMLLADEYLSFVQKCEVYSYNLKTNGNLIATQPILREGYPLSNNTDWNFTEIDTTTNVHVGYYHIKVYSIEECYYNPQS
jgi:hypothetical protein